MTDTQVIIMAAGMGSRFGSLKQMEGLGPSHEFLMDYAIYDAHKAGVNKICLVVRESFLDQIKDHMQTQWREYKDLEFNFVCQEISDLPSQFEVPSARAKPWGTAHVLYVLRKTVKTPFVIINADDFYGRQGLQTAISFLDSNPEKHGLVGYPLQNTLSPFGPVTRGVCEIQDGKLIGIDEVPKIYHDDKRQALASMNLWCFAPDIFNHIEPTFEEFLKEKLNDPTAEYQIPQIINDLIKSSEIEVSALSTDSQWFGVTYKEDKEAVQKKLRELVTKGTYPSNLFQL